MMNKIVQYKPELDILTNEYWLRTGEEQRAAAGWIQTAINRGKALAKVKAACEYGEWGKWCADNDVGRTTAWNYIQLAENEETILRLFSSVEQPKLGLREALRLLDQELKFTKEAKDLQDNITKASKRFMESLIKMKEFLEKNPDAEFDVDPEFVFAIDEAKIALDGLNERFHYDRPSEQGS